MYHKKYEHHQKEKKKNGVNVEGKIEQPTNAD